MKFLNTIMSVFFVLLGFLLAAYALLVIIAGFVAIEESNGTYNSFVTGQFIGYSLTLLFGLWLFVRGLKGIRKNKTPKENTEYLDL